MTAHKKTDDTPTKAEAKGAAKADDRAAPTHAGDPPPGTAPAPPHPRKAADVPRKDGEVDVAKLKEQRREKPDESPAERAERVGETGDKGESRPAIIHALPHVAGTRHEAGQDPDEVKKDAKEAGGTAEENSGEPGTDNAQVLYGLRKEGRLFRCRQEGLPTLMVEADTAEQAKEAYVTEMQRRAGDDPESLKPKKGAAGPGGAGTLVPPGMALVPATGADTAPKVNAETVNVTKLAP